MTDKERIEALELQVKLLWEVLLRIPRLDGVHDAILIAGLLRDPRDITMSIPQPLKPMLFDEEKHLDLIRTINSERTN